MQFLYKKIKVYVMRDFCQSRFGKSRWQLISAITGANRGYAG